MHLFYATCGAAKLVQFCTESVQFQYETGEYLFNTGATSPQ